jgi:toxin-antitoxin system PIN domain toxin
LIHLLDVNVLIALLDRHHVAHISAWRWFPEVQADGWATCPFTQAGYVRIVSGASYRPSPVPIADAASALADMCATPGHEFWPADGSFLDADFIDAARLGKGGHVTDAYLPALAAARGGRLATFDRKLRTDAVAGGKASLCVIPA